MQVIKARRDALLKPLAQVGGIVEKRNTMPILANVLIEKDGANVLFTGSDMDMQIRTRAEIGSGAEATRITVSARKLMDILKSLPDQDVTLTQQGAKLNLASGRSRFALQTMNAEDFPTIATGESPQASVTLKQRALRHLMQQVHFAMAQQDIRYYLNGLLLVLDPAGLHAVATDGHRLAYSTTRGDEIGEPASAHADVIIPRKTVMELLRQLGDTEQDATVEVINHQIRVRFGELVLISKLVEGRFPDYQRVIPSGYHKAIALNRDEFMGALVRASILTNDKFKGVRLSLKPQVLQIQSSNSEHEEAVEELDIMYSGEELDIGFNVSYLLDVLQNLKSDLVKIEFGDSNSSALLSMPGDDSFKYVIMPMKI